jgi:hypothetical protein
MEVSAMAQTKLMHGLAVARAALRAIQEFDEEKVLGEHLENAEQELMRAQVKLRCRPIGTPNPSTPRAS